ncbi:hypothetical protein K7W03_24405 [Sphingobium sp. PNB]|uniref:hypothetical protein n=1 Tax=Sphingobium sp. PNB TaxID=863934 RepID=UPI001CA3DA0C|nr:hypothetical protein [Sphingobium sp. PNB]MCB4862733.1 hypothetical protein [Sphingobium sp. PNB]
MRKFIVLLSLALATACANEAEQPKKMEPQEIYLSCKETIDTEERHLTGGAENSRTRTVENLYRINLTKPQLEWWNDEGGKFEDNCTRDVGCTVKITQSEISTATDLAADPRDKHPLIRNGWMKIGRTTGKLTSYHALAFPNSMKEMVSKSSGACQVAQAPQRKF